MTGRATLLLVEERCLWAEGLTLALERLLSVEVVAVGSLAALAAQVERADVLVFDIDRHAEATEAVRRHGEARPGLRIIGLQAAPSVATARRALEVGVRALVPRDAGVAAVARAVAPALLSVQRLARDQPATALVRTLSDREREVLAHLAAGLRTAQVAQALGLRAKTVDSHKQRLYAKLGVQSAAQAVGLWLTVQR